MNKTHWIRVRRDRLCPICGKPDWCRVLSDNSIAQCGRIESNHPAGNNGAGWIHELGDSINDQWLTATNLKPEKPQPKRDAKFWEWLYETCRAGLTLSQQEWLSKELGLSKAALQAMGVGWSVRYNAYTFPMRNAAGQIVGIRTRRLSGQKRSVPGTDGNGLFFSPGKLVPEYLLVCEGPTDTAALIDVGFGSVVGKPSCRAGDSHLLRLVRHLRPKHLILIPDSDKAGLDGFGDLAVRLLADGFNPNAMDHLHIPTGAKDVRQWKKNGCEHLRQTLTAKLQKLTQSEGDRT